MSTEVKRNINNIDINQDTRIKGIKTSFCSGEGGGEFKSVH
jgi:hypothetical protein